MQGVHGVLLVVGQKSRAVLSFAEWHLEKANARALLLSVADAL
jgi:hypothetical protein